MDICNILLLILLFKQKNNCSNNSNKNTIFNVRTSDKHTQGALEVSTTYTNEDSLEIDNLSNLSNSLDNISNFKYETDFSMDNCIPEQKDISHLPLSLKDHNYTENQLDLFIRENYQGKNITAETTSGHIITGELVSINDNLLSIKTKDGILHFLEHKNINYYY